jgi:hypothetical protein
VSPHLDKWLAIAKGSATSKMFSLVSVRICTQGAKEVSWCRWGWWE